MVVVADDVLIERLIKSLQFCCFGAQDKHKIRRKHGMCAMVLCGISIFSGLSTRNFSCIILFDICAFVNYFNFLLCLGKKRGKSHVSEIFFAV